MERLSRKQKYQEYRDELKKDNEAFANTQALNNYQNKIDQLQSQFEGGQTNEAPVKKENPPQEEPVKNIEDVKEEVNIADFSEEYKDLFDLLNDSPTVEDKPVEPVFVEPEPVNVEEPEQVDIVEVEAADIEEPKQAEIIENEPVDIKEPDSDEVVVPVYEEPIVEIEPTINELESSKEPEQVYEEPAQDEPTIIETTGDDSPIVIDTTQDLIEETNNADISEIDTIVQGIDNFDAKPAETYVEPDIAEFNDVKPIEPIYKQPAQEEVNLEQVQDAESIVEPEPIVVEEPVKEEVFEEPVSPVVELQEEPVKEEIKFEEVKPVQEFEPIKEPDGIEIKNLDELVQEEKINATLTDTIPFVIDDEAVKEAIEEYNDEEEIEEEEEVPNKVLNVILVILIVVLVIVLGLIVYYILAGQGIIG